MHIRLIAVGGRQPGWVDAACEHYAARFPRDWQFRIDTIATARRGKSDRKRDARQTESKEILAALRQSEQVVLLDEAGKQYNSTEFSARLSQWQTDGRDLCFIIGGPDGVSAACRERADAVWSLSRLTLPHGLARVLFLEQLYRARTLQLGHPYHRE